MDEQVEHREVKTDRISRPGARRRNRLIPLFALLALVLLGFAAWRLLAPIGSAGEHSRQAVQAQPVGAARIVAGELPVVLSGLGTVTPLATITVQTQINGQLMSVGFKEGQIVQKGAFLAQIDPRPYQAALDLAEATLEHDSELLAQAKSDLQRYALLGRQDSIAQQQVTDQEFLVKQDQGTVDEDKANIETDKLNLVYCHIVAPVTGRVGLRLVDPGNYVQTTSTTGLVVLTQLQPISVIFVLPQTEVPVSWQNGQTGIGLPVDLYDGSDTRRIDTGTLTSVDNEMDTTTGTVKLRATFPNQKFQLFPNEFVNARLYLRTLHNATIAPVAAIQHGAPGAFVYLIKANSTVAVQPVKTGVSYGGQIQILSGVKPGDTVVVDGADQLRNGMKVRITPDLGDQQATVNDGPGAPPGEQPDNAVSITKKQRKSSPRQTQCSPVTERPGGR
jgi:membrane fusion protein, multidrug efflux system